MRNILKNPVRIEKIFRASEYNFEAAKFHQYCDNKNDTLVLIRTEFGKTIGGYTHYPWISSNGEYVHDSEKRAFIFSLDLKEKYIPQDENNLIYCNSSEGPSFGGGIDIRILDDCNNTLNSYCNFPSTYNLEG